MPVVHARKRDKLRSLQWFLVFRSRFEEPRLRSGGLARKLLKLSADLRHSERHNLRGTAAGMFSTAMVSGLSSVGAEGTASCKPDPFVSSRRKLGSGDGLEVFGSQQGDPAALFRQPAFVLPSRQQAARRERADVG